MNELDIIKKEAEVLITKLNIDADLSVEQLGEEYGVHLKVEDDAPMVIGKYGENLNAIQRVLEAILYKILNKSIVITVNVNDYRERQKERLEAIAGNIATRVLKDKNQASIDSFSAYERKLVHEFIGANYPELTTFSEGEGINRKLTIKIKD